MEKEVYIHVATTAMIKTESTSTMYTAVLLVAIATALGFVCGVMAGIILVCDYAA